jgi:hypothetical protein
MQRALSSAEVLTDRDVPVVGELTYLTRRLQSIDIGHLHVHENDRVAFGFFHGDGFSSIFCGIDDQIDSFQL